MSSPPPDSATAAKEHTADDDIQTAPRKSRCMTEPDAVVVVGGEEFQVSSHALRLASDYFDAAFRSGMKESESMRFEFPDKNPRDWKLIESMLGPFSKVKVTMENLDRLLPWFDELCMPQGLDECDRVLYATRLWSGTVVVSKTDLLDLLEKGLQYDLSRTKAHCFEHIRAILSRNTASNECFCRQEIDRILDLVVARADCRRELWSVLQQYIPKTVVDPNEQDVLIRSGILQELIVADTERKKHQREVNSLTASLSSTADELSRCRGQMAVCPRCFQHSYRKGIERSTKGERLKA